MSKVEFLDPAAMSMVETANVAYKFTLYTANDVPMHARIWVTWPLTWNVGCNGGDHGYDV